MKAMFYGAPWAILGSNPDGPKMKTMSYLTGYLEQASLLPYNSITPHNYSSVFQTEEFRGLTTFTVEAFSFFLLLLDSQIVYRLQPWVSTYDPIA